jgi:hypothetical protein
MKIRFVSHASFSLESGGITLLSDPWLFGKAFNQGWALLSPAATVPWEKIDYVWISHQHPDHLHFPTLKSLPPQEKNRLTMLYQKHASPRIPKVLRGLGYPNVQELTLNKWTTLRGGIKVLCGSVGSMDSWMAIHADKMKVLNLNDCIIEPDHLKVISKLVGKVTVLLTQFSFANWIGNYADELGEAEAKLRDLRFRVDLLKPEATIPFASFIYFCNQENCWMNEFAVTPKRIADMGLSGVNFMYPGDEWNSDIRNFHSTEAVDKYMNDIAGPKVIDGTPPSVSIHTVQQAVNRTLRTVRLRFGRFLIARIKPFSIYLHDLDKVLIVNPAGTCDACDATQDLRESARYVMCSQMAWFAFAFSWGWAAMDVSGMYSDRRLRESNPLAFYLNQLSTECLSFGSVRQTKRTLEFLWAKRHELAYRARTHLNRRTQSAVETGSQQEAFAERRAS